MENLEIWLVHEKYYVMVSNQGRCLSCHPNPKVQVGVVTSGTPQGTRDGIIMMMGPTSRLTNKRVHKPVHHLVVDCFFPGSVNRRKSLVIRHLDGNKTNNNVDNLKIITRAFARMNKK
jgi:hypothetical protein